MEAKKIEFSEGDGAEREISVPFRLSRVRVWRQGDGAEELERQRAALGEEAYIYTTHPSMGVIGFYGTCLSRAPSHVISITPCMIIKEKPKLWY